MTDYVTIKRSDIEALPRCADINGRETSIKVEDLRALLDKAQSVEPVAYQYKYHKKGAWILSEGFTNKAMLSYVKQNYPEFEMRELYTSPHAAESLEEVCAIAYPCVGTLLNDAGRLDSDEGDKLLTMLSDMKPDDTLLPFSSGKQVAELEARIAELEKDARRYQWLRPRLKTYYAQAISGMTRKALRVRVANDLFDYNHNTRDSYLDKSKFDTEMQELDEAIDQAMEKTNGD